MTEHTQGINMQGTKRKREKKKQRLYNCDWCLETVRKSKSYKLNRSNKRNCHGCMRVPLRSYYGRMEKQAKEIEALKRHLRKKEKELVVLRQDKLLEGMAIDCADCVMPKQTIDLLVKMGEVNVDKDGKPHLRKRAY